MQSSTSIDSFYPEGPHVPLLVAAIPVGVLQSLLHAFSSDPDAVLGSPSKPFCKLKYLILVHLSLSIYIFCASDVFGC